MSERMIKPIRFSREEWEMICRKAEEAELKPSAYVRWTALHGQVKVYNTDLVNDMLVQFNSIGILINQIAKVVNMTGSVFKKDIEDIQQQMKNLTVVIDSYLKQFETEDII